MHRRARRARAVRVIPPEPARLQRDVPGVERVQHRVAAPQAPGFLPQPERPLQPDALQPRRRLRQANLFGPAGYVSADDGEVIEMQQHGFAARDDYTTISELGGRDVGSSDHMVTETLIRGMYRYYREVMGF